MGGNKKKRNKNKAAQQQQTVSQSAEPSASVESPELQAPVSAPEDVKQIISQQSAEPLVESPEQQAQVIAPVKVPQDNTVQEIKVEVQQQEETITTANVNTDGDNTQQTDKNVEENKTALTQDNEDFSSPIISDEPLQKVDDVQDQKIEEKDDDVKVTSKDTTQQDKVEVLTQQVETESLLQKTQKVEQVQEQKVADPILDVTPTKPLSNLNDIQPEVKIQAKIEQVPVVQDMSQSSNKNQMKSKKKNNYFAQEEDTQNSTVKVMKVDLPSPFDKQLNLQGQGDMSSDKEQMQANSLTMTQSGKPFGNVKLQTKKRNAVSIQRELDANILKDLERSAFGDSIMKPTTQQQNLLLQQQQNMTSFQPEKIEIQKLILKVHYETKFGQDLWLLGSPDFLSKWNPNENGGRGGMQMKWTDGHQWIAEIPYMLVNDEPSQRFEFKFMVKFNDTQKQTYDIIKWESGTINHTFDGLHVQKFLKDDFTKNDIMNKIKDPQSQSVISIGTFQGNGQLHQEGSQEIKKMADDVHKCTLSYDKMQKALIFHQYFQG